MFRAFLLALLPWAQSDASDTRIFGQITLIDRAGRSIEDASGRFELQACYGSGMPFGVQFQNGRYEVRVPMRPGWIEVYGMRTAAGPALVETDLIYPKPNWDGRLDLVGHMAEPCILRVLDAETALPLACVDVTAWVSNAGVLSRFTAVDGSRVVLDPLVEEREFLRQGTVSWRVCAAGHVDEILDIDPRLGGDRVVWLGPAGGLGIRVVGAALTRHTRVEVFDLERQSDERIFVDPEQWPLLERMRPGAYSIRVVHETLDDKRTVLGERTVIVQAGAVTWESVPIAPPPFDPCDGPL